MRDGENRIIFGKKWTDNVYVIKQEYLWTFLLNFLHK